ncbi:HAD family hydrolase [Flavobacterium sp. S87F.05.LMB.W.Kidney.N]|uniref:HAD family hydrolase n=1 Tax=Flavobacterium sp. S87F.05.LMB.W.Kidney.N TaxID=1278758 RepID=UPI0010EBE0EF|nr:HAD family hydrolase [Flavobacterium sp. S87F.05.LMB.W.Kidney.N]TDX11304.1 phosphoglycolate phosphatase-like HAD superfamily hydrolase [Flavobacterium sp. S87F.05.LMB.W.Kidney.N]
MNDKIIKCVVTDLDDTIWDWLNMWYGSFYPYFKEIKTRYEIDDTILKADFKKLHQKYNTTEVSFAYDELTSLSSANKLDIIAKPKKGKSIYHNYNSNKKSKLKLYDGVLETLVELKSKGVLIIGFTESNAFFTKYRIKHLGLDGIFDCIYSPLDTGIPQNTHRVYDDEFWEPKLTEIRYLSKSTKKPDSEILGIILRDFKVKNENAIYIGDKIDRDIRMAIDTGVTSVYAKYGSEIDNKKYQLLKEVTHWTSEDVAREIEFQNKHKNDEITPDYTLNYSFNEILSHFSFSSYQDKLNIDLLPTVVSIWSDTVKVQQHFNDIGLRIRNLSLTAFTFIIATLGYIIKENLIFNVGNYEIKAVSLIALIGALIIWCFLFMDKNWYHKYLVGASIQASCIENKWNKLLPELNLSTSISKQSTYQYYFVNFKSFKKFGVTLNSNKRFRFFYYPLIGVLLVFSFASFFMDSNASKDKVKDKQVIFLYPVTNALNKINGLPQNKYSKASTESAKKGLNNISRKTNDLTNINKDKDKH